MLTIQRSFFAASGIMGNGACTSWNESGFFLTFRKAVSALALMSAENAGRLADLDQVPVRIPDIGPDLAPVVLGLGEELDALG